MMKNTQVVLLAGGLGTRISEETDRMPKPMVPIGGRPILWHIMKYYSQFGMKDFIICGGYKVDVLIEYFSNYRLHTSDLCIDIKRNEITYFNEASDDWKVTIINTGDTTQTGGRLARVRKYLNPDRPFCMTYGDGLSNTDIGAAFEQHVRQGVEATLTAVRPPARFGSVHMADGLVTSFSEKPVTGEGHINGGFFVLNHTVFDFIENDLTVWEHGPLEQLALQGKLGAYVHNGFWQPMDTLRDRRHLEQLWQSEQAPWKVWK